MGLKKRSVVKAGWDLAFLAGAAACVYGLWLAWHPLGFIVGGGLLAAGAFFQGYWASRRRE